MAAGSTYTPIATYTVPSSAASYTFTSISGSYTDLIMVWSGTAGGNISLQFNSDSGSNYSATRMRGNGSAASSVRWSNVTSMYGATPSLTNTSTATWQIQNYSNATTYKTALCRGGTADDVTEAYVGLWRNTAAITSVTVLALGSTMATGSTLTLYGIASA